MLLFILVKENFNLPENVGEIFSEKLHTHGIHVRPGESIACAPQSILVYLFPSLRREYSSALPPRVSAIEKALKALKAAAHAFVDTGL